MMIMRESRPTDTRPTVRVHTTCGLASIAWSDVSSSPTVYVLRPKDTLKHPLANPEVSPKPAVVTVEQMTKDLKDAGIPVSAMADMAGVERKTIYSWMDGAGESRPQKTFRLQQIYRLLFPAAYRDLRDIYRLWSTPVEGDTLKALLSSPLLEDDKIQHVLKGIVAQSRMSAARRSRISSPGGPNGFIEGLETSTSI